MSCLQLQNLSFSFLDRVLFSNVNIKIEAGERVALIGANGTGKTTLFKLITNEHSPTEGAVVIGKDTALGYMEQYSDFIKGTSVYDCALKVFSDIMEMENELEEVHKELTEHPNNFSLIERQLFLTEEIQNRDGLVYKAKTRSTLLGLGFNEDDLNKDAAVLSGGEQSKLALCKLLLSNSQLILLDEPTNHLDIDSMAWLEDFLTKYKGAAIIISHDRFFLERTTSKTMEITNKKIYMTSYSYTTHKNIVKEKQLSIEREYEKSLKEIKRIEGIIEQQKQFNRERNYVTIASKQKQIEKISANLEVPDSLAAEVRFSFKIRNESGADVLSLVNISKSFNDNHLFSNVDLSIQKGDRVFLLGANGSGKSSLLKIITGELKSNSGFVKLGQSVKMGYFDQSISKLTNSNTVLDEVWGLDRSIDQTQIRKALAAFLFFRDDVNKKIYSLSGGEKARVALLKLMLIYPNFLLLDEPTNHLDISSREAFEDALLDFDGTILAVSHDRYLINKLATKIAVLQDNKIEMIEGNYNSYLQYKENAALDNIPLPKNHKKSDYKLRKERESEIRRRKSQIARLEQHISKVEKEIMELEEKMASPEISTDYIKLCKSAKTHKECKELLDNLYAEWEGLHS
ncbi:MAG: ABC-F family ATP-binding cassette domain-containing protein [Clostridiales bacterium]|nr:ABC-F family ATP-binding cassette domain-containing protein [Clostridiales bacterium]